MIEYLTSSVIVIPLFGAFIHLMIAKAHTRFSNRLQLCLVFLWLVVSVLLLLQLKQSIFIRLGDWAPPFGITIVVDKLSSFMLAIFAVVAFCINFYSYSDKDILSAKRPIFYAGFWLLLLGISGALLTRDIFNLYVWFEVILVSSLILLSTTRHPKLHALFNYAMMNIVGTLLMLLSIALIYGLNGALSYDEISHYLTQDTSRILPILCLFIFSLGVKGALFPLYFWLPRSYPKTSVSSTMLLSSLVTKVVMIILLRFVWLWPILQHKFFLNSLLCVALATMFFGVIGAASQFRFKDILAFHIISQIGYIVLAIVLPFPMAVIAAIYFIVHNILVKTILFMIAGIIQQHIGTDDFKKLGSMLKHHKWLAFVFFIAAMSLAGFPPLSGFWAKFILLKVAIIHGFYISAAIAIIVSLLTLYSMIKIWRYVFSQTPKLPQSKPQKVIPFSLSLNLAILPLFVIMLIIGLFPDSLLQLLTPIASQLTHIQPLDLYR
ncbi:complex I subunit 5 family protein [Cysteiniphilum sp. 6C5]|uniref:complex I subunit 5 family protein n=1 Tax=unclassified Cysteiniphilum TaxID=2610889 RepID=UPI003F8479CE